MPDIQPTETVVETPAAPAAPAAPAELPADHPLVKTLAIQKAELKELREKERRLTEVEDSQKTESQRLADATAKAQRDADEARAEALRYKVAATHGVSSDYFDLLGSGDEAAITERAQRIQTLLTASAENTQLKAELEAARNGKPSPTASRPVVDLKPGASPDGQKSDGDLAYEALYGSN